MTQKWKPCDIEVNDESDVYTLLSEAIKNRSVATTSMNERSSRSHCIYQFKIWEAPEKECGALNLIDLAGSERANKSNAVGIRLEEANAINKSLSCLAECINSISTKAAHVPFRNSKLTFLLQNYLKGGAKVLMIANVSPLKSSVQETFTSLKFAKQVNECRVNAKKEQLLTNLEELEYDQFVTHD